MYFRRFFICFFVLSLFFSPGSLFSQNKELITYFENSAYLETPRYNQTVKFCRLLDSLSPQIFYTNFGFSPQGMELPLLIADKDGNFTPESVRKSGKIVVLIQACIHAGESEGKDAGLLLFRDIISDKNVKSLLNHCTILFIPIYNTDGHERFGPYNRINQNGPEEMGWRTNARNLNLNRDYLKADATETQNWLKLYSKWLPDFFIDIHTTDGADYQYTLTYGMETFGNSDSALTTWMKKEYFTKLSQKLSAKQLDLIPYIMFRNWHDPRSGLTAAVSAPMLSTGYNAIQNRAGILVETHMLKSYKNRVYAALDLVKATLEILNSQYEVVIGMNMQADGYAASEEFRKKPFPLKFQCNDSFSIIDFKGFKYDTVRSEISGGLWFSYSKTPATFKIKYFNDVHPVVVTHLPEAYIIPPEWTEVISRLDFHHIQYKRIKAPLTIKVSTYRFKNVKWRTKSYEGRLLLSYDLEEIEIERTFPVGSVLVNMNQRTARIIAHLLEPSGPDALVYWGFFNSVFEQKEYGENYVIEKMAKDMLDQNPGLKIEFEQKKTNDPDFAKDPEEILNWFYSKSPYWDQNINLYPVGKIFDKNIIMNL